MLNKLSKSSSKKEFFERENLISQRQRKPLSLKKLV